VTLKFELFPHVYPPQTDTFFLIEHACATPEDCVLELCTGCGVIALHLALTARCVSAIDNNPHAVVNARHNANINGVENVIIRLGDLYEPVRGQRFDLIVANPPYVPTPLGWRETDIIETAWNAGPDGRRILNRIIDGLSEHLTANGRLLFVQSSLSDIGQTEKRLQERGFSCWIRAQKWIPFGPISRGRFEWLKQQSPLIHPDQELLVVVEAHRIRNKGRARTER